jgi:hypothetical protein
VDSLDRAHTPSPLGDIDEADTALGRDGSRGTPTRLRTLTI